MEPPRGGTPSEPLRSAVTELLRQWLVTGSAGDGSTPANCAGGDDASALAPQTWLKFLFFVLCRVDAQMDFSHAETLWQAAVVAPAAAPTAAAVCGLRATAALTLRTTACRQIYLPLPLRSAVYGLRPA